MARKKGSLWLYGCGLGCATNEGCGSVMECHCGTMAYGPGGTGRSVCWGTLANASGERCSGAFRCATTGCDPGWFDCDSTEFNGCEAMSCP